MKKPKNEYDRLLRAEREAERKVYEAERQLEAAKQARMEYRAKNRTEPHV